jgi:hypothetical protein
MRKIPSNSHLTEQAKRSGKTMERERKSSMVNLLILLTLWMNLTIMENGENGLHIEST